MTATLDARLAEALDQARRNGTYKTLRHLEGAVGPHVGVEGAGEVLLMASNDYLALSAHPEVIAGGKAALERFGASTGSVRFICGTLTIHRALEQALARFLGTPAALTYSSCWAANTGLIPAITRPGDVILSDALNHASIIDGCRLAHRDVVRETYRHADMEDLAAKLAAHRGAPARFIVSDGVFSMEGDVAPLDRIVALARAHDATVILDDSHGMGVLGATGRGTPEHFGLHGGIDILTGTLGKAVGGGTGGFVAASPAVTETLVQVSRPHLFSNALPASVAGASLAALTVLEREPERVARLRANAARFRAALAAAGIAPLPGESAIVPVIVGDTARAIRIADCLFTQGLFVTGFGFPVVPEGHARLRFQISAGHTAQDLDWAVATVRAAWGEAG
jgi:glycine C-acetyltransferase